MQTGENEQALRKILDMTRLISIAILLLHFYYYCYTAFEQWGFTTTLTDRLMGNIRSTGLSQLSNFQAIRFGVFDHIINGCKRQEG